MKNFIKENKIIIIIVFIIIFIIIFITPMIIYILYSFYTIKFLEYKIEAGDLLLYFASIFSAIFPLSGVFKTIITSKKLQKEDTYNKVKPFIAVESLNVRSKKNFYEDFGLKKKEINAEINEYEEFLINELCYIIDANNIIIKDKLVDSQMELIRNKGNKIEEISKGLYAVVQKDFFALFLLAKNVGNGCAINLNIGIIKEGVKEVFSIASTCNVGREIIIRIFSEQKRQDVQGTYYLTFRYNDILLNEHVQKYKLIICDDDGKSRFEVNSINKFYEKN